MKNRPHNPTPQDAQGYLKPGRTQSSPRRDRAIHPVKALPAVPQPRRSRWASTLVSMAVLCSGTGLVVGGAWLGVQVIVNPDAIVWINQFLPAWTQIPIARPESLLTLTEIQTQIRQEGLIPGEPIALGANPTLPADSTSSDSDLLLPVLAQRSDCNGVDADTNPTAVSTSCERIVELRVYKPFPSPRHRFNPESYLTLVAQESVTGPEESFAIAPLSNAGVGNQGSTRILPLTTVSRMDSQAPGIWLELSGQLTRGNTAIAYGQILHYNPERSHLSLMPQWTSPAGQAPYWEEVTGGDTPELVINQTVGLEPQFQIYQVKPRDFLPDPIELDAISLAEPASDDPAYNNALILARNGLWSPALRWMQALQQRTQKNSAWTATIQAQLDTIRLHAQATKAQAEQSWASPSQQVLTNLIDGRWAAALQVFQASSENRREVTSLLKADTGRLWNRVEAALKVDPQPEVKAWGALIQIAQQNRSAAIAWLNKQPQNTSTSNQLVYAVLNQFDATFAIAKTTENHPSRLIGSIEQLNQVNADDWLQPQQATALKLADQQVWYQVQVAGFNDGKTWQQAPFASLKLPKTAPAQALWQLLGLKTDPEIQIIVWAADGQQSTIGATVKAAQLKGGVLRLLATGAAIPKTTLVTTSSDREPLPQPLALTATALQWLEPNSMLLSSFAQQQPQQVAKILPIVWRELQQADQLSEGALPRLEVMQQRMQDWTVQSIDLTGNNQPEVILTLDNETLLSLKKSLLAKSADPAATAEKPNPASRAGVDSTSPHRPLPRPRTLIFSDSGKLIYNELGAAAPQSLTAIADLGDNGPATLVVEGANAYSLQRWSAKQRRFE